MPELVFRVQGSAPEPYEVSFKNNGTAVWVTCDCEAGLQGTYCKHRLRIISGLADDIIDAKIEDILSAQEMIKGTPIEAALAVCSALEREADDLKRRTKAAKKRLANALLGRAS